MFVRSTSIRLGWKGLPRTNTLLTFVNCGRKKVLTTILQWRSKKALSNLRHLSDDERSPPPPKELEKLAPPSCSGGEDVEREEEWREVENVEEFGGLFKTDVPAKQAADDDGGGTGGATPPMVKRDVESSRKADVVLAKSPRKPKESVWLWRLPPAGSTSPAGLPVSWPGTPLPEEWKRLRRKLCFSVTFWE